MSKGKNTSKPAEPRVVRERLQKVLARAGLASRRKCEHLITEGRVTVDGKTVTKLGTTVDSRKQEIRCDGELLKHEKLIYILLYKPRGYICSARPAQGQHSVLELVSEFSQRLFPVGRLDMDSEGLLILTNDGKLSAHLTHPRFGVSKTYRITISGRLSDEQVRELTKPEWTSAGKMKLAGVKVITRTARRSELEIVLGEGKNREIRRVLAAKGIKVRRLIRTAIGPLGDRNLAAGQYRYLTEGELNILSQLWKKR